MRLEDMHRLEVAFDHLPEHYRDVIVMARLQGMSRAEIAQRTGSTERAVRILLYRALARLAELLTQ
jgi:RNA polymerase sigma factor (sigma-70 family)